MLVLGKEKKQTNKQTEKSLASEQRHKLPVSGMKQKIIIKEPAETKGGTMNNLQS